MKKMQQIEDKVSNQVEIHFEEDLFSETEEKKVVVQNKKMILMPMYRRLPKFTDPEETQTDSLRKKLEH